MGGGGENRTLGATRGWWWQGGTDLFFSTIFSMFRGYFVIRNSTQPEPTDRLCPLGDIEDGQTGQEGPREVSHGPDGNTEARQAVSTDRRAWRVHSALCAEQTAPGRPPELGAFLCGNAGKTTPRGVEDYFWQGAQANGSACRDSSGSQWPGGRVTWGKLVQRSWVSDSSPVK